MKFKAILPKENGFFYGSFVAMQDRLLQIGLLAFSISLAYGAAVQIIFPEGHLSPDSWSYLNIAYNLFEHQTFSQLIDYPNILDAMRTPGYPFLIYLFHWLKIGVYGIVLTQAIFFGLSAMMLFKILMDLLKSRELASLFSLFFVFDIPSIYMSSTVMTETIFVFLLLCSFYFALRVASSKSISIGIVAGVCLGAAALFRPIALYLGLIIPLTGFFLAKWKGSRSLVFVLSFALVCAPWMLRNQSNFGVFNLSLVGELNILFHTSSNILADVNGSSRQAEELKLRDKYFDENEWKEASYPKNFASAAHKELRLQLIEHPLVFVKLYCKSFVYFFTKPMRSYISEQFGWKKTGPWFPVEPNTRNQPTNPSWIWPLLLFQLGMLFILYLGFIPLSSILNKKDVVWLLLLGLLYFSSVSALTEADARLRVVAIPLIVMLSALGWKKRLLNEL